MVNDFFMISWISLQLSTSMASLSITTQEEHNVHVSQVLQRIRKYGLYAKLRKCSFHKNQVEFLGYVVGIPMDVSKLQMVLHCETPTSARDIQCF